MWTPIIFFVLLSVLVLVHEIGHFLAAKKIGVKVEEFGLGYPPRLFGKKIGETIYSLNLLPFGGFVKLFGENGESHSDKASRDKGSESKRAFYNRSKLERAIILVAGVSMNFLLGVVVISIIFTNGVLIPSEKVYVQQVIKNSPAFLAGIKENDQIVSLNGKAIKTPQDLIVQTKEGAGKEVSLVIKRCTLEKIDNVPTGKENNCSTIEKVLVPRTNVSPKEGPMGVAISNLVVKKYPLWQAPIYGTREAFRMSYLIAEGVLKIFGQLIFKANLPSDVAGPIGIYQITSEAVKFGPLAILQLLGLLSLNLAVVNILPIPALDGGRLAMIFLEVIVGKRKLERYENLVSSIGFATIIGLIVLITFSDLNRIFKFQELIKHFSLPFR
ncbi:site-2 protease family protein [Candidatus Microgenomates bacterium]|nr:site-2 protease family protein [Candidatus Microgenomates bacterium]